MLRSFMVEFRYEEEIHFAHISEYKDAPYTFYVTILSLRSYPARKLILKKVNDKIELSPNSQPAPKELVALLGKKIEEKID